MKVRNFIKQIIPPILSDIYINYKNGFKGMYIWKGIYKNFKDVPVTGKSYFSEKLSQETSLYTQSLLKGWKEKKNIPYHINQENTFLPFISSLILQEKKKISILDLGGGMGIGFVSLISCIGKIEALNYYLIETPNMCEGGDLLFKEDKRIHFLKDFPVELPEIDIVYVSSALQYFENYKDILKKLAGYNPKYFLFIKFSAGEIPTYATCQKNLAGTTSAYWFFNMEEITAIMSNLGYSLKFKSSLDRNYNQDNFPLEYRLNKACNLLFSKN